MAKQPHRRLVVLLERCDAIVAPVTPSRAKTRLPRSPKIELIDRLSLARSLARRGKVRKKSSRAKKKKKETSEKTETCDGELRCDSVSEQLVDQNEESPEQPSSVSKSVVVSAPLDTDPTPPTSEDDQPPVSTEPLDKSDALDPIIIRAPERLSLFDQMPLLLLENDDFFPAPEDPLLVDPATLMLAGSGEALAVDMGSRNSSFSGEFPPVEFCHELNNDVMLADVANRSMLLEVEELLVPDGAVTMETSAAENIEFGQNDFAIDDEMDWNCEQPWPLLEPGANLPDGHGPLNSSLEAGDSDDEFGQRMREEFLARRLRCSTRLQNLQSRRSAERSLSESDNLDSDGKTVIRKRSREVPNLDVPNADVTNLDATNIDVQDELFVQKKSKIRRIHSKLNNKIVVPVVEPTASEVDGKTDAVEFPTTNLEEEKNILSARELEGLTLKKGNRKDRLSTETKAKTTLASQNEVETIRDRKNSLRTSAQSSDDGRNNVRKSVDVPLEEAMMSTTKKMSSKAKENKLMSERVSTNDPKLPKSLLNSVEAAKLKYMLMKKEREASELKESNSEDKTKKTKDGAVKNPCREPGCSASAQPDSIFCSSECLSRHVNESIKLLAQDRLKTYNRGQEPGHSSGISDAAKATERIVVFERKTGKLVTGPLAPTESSLLAWLQRHPTFEVVQPEQAIGHVSGNLKNRKKRPFLHGDRRNGADPNNAGTQRLNLSGVAPSDRTQKTSGNDTKASSAKSQTAVTNNATRPDSTSNNNNRSHTSADEKIESDERLNPLRLNTRSELRHLLLDRLERNVSTSRVKRLAIDIECELWTTAGRRSSSLYKQKFNGLVRILKRPSSQDLCRRLLCAEMKPNQLLQQMKELQRSDASIAKNSMVNPLDLLCDLKDTTDRHGDHIFDVGCRICSGRLTRTNECDRLQPPTSSDTACSNKVSSDLDGNASKPEVSSRPENGIVEGDSGRYEANGTNAALIKKISVDGFSTREVEMPLGGVEALDVVLSMNCSPMVTSEVDSKTTSHDLLPSTALPSTTSVPPSPAISSSVLESSNTCSSTDSIAVSSPTLTTSSISSISACQSIPVPSSRSTSSEHSSLDQRLSNIPSGSLSEVPTPSVEISPMCPPTPNVNPIMNVDQVQFVFSPTSTRTSAPGTSLSTSTSSSLTVATSHSSIETRLLLLSSMPLSTRHSSVEMLSLSSMPLSTRHSSVEMLSLSSMPVSTRHSSMEMLSSPSKHSVAEIRLSGSEEGSSSSGTTTSRPLGLNRLKSSTTSSMSSNETLVDLVWKGSVAALDGATMQLCAYRTSGSMKIVRSVLPAMVTVMGRIDPKTVDDYLQKIRQQYTATREIAVICFHCHDDSERSKYNQLFNYLQERRRCGVIGSISNAIKDMYIWPLPANAPIPPVLLPFNGPGLDVNRRDVLLGIIIQQAVRSRGHAVTKQPTTSTNPIRSSNNIIVVAPKNNNNNTKISADSAPTAQDNLSRSFASKNESVSSATNDESSDDVSDDDLKTFAQADPIVSKYSKARPQIDLLIQAKTKDLDKPYDPCDEDYEIIDPTTAAQNQMRREAELNGFQKLTEAVSLKLDTQHKHSETSSEIHPLSNPLNSLTKDAKHETDKSQHGHKNDSKTTKHDVDALVCSKPHESSNLSCTDKLFNGRKSSIDIQNTGNAEVPRPDREKNEAKKDVTSTGESSTDEINSSKLTSNAFDESHATSNDDPMSSKPSTEMNRVDNCEACVTAHSGSVALGTAVGHPSVAVQSSEATNADATSAETLTKIATMLKQLSEKNALNEENLRSLLDQLLSVYGAQNDRQQRAILLQLVETIEKQHSLVDKQQSVTENQQSVTENQQSVTENQQSVTERQQSVTERQQSVTERQQSVSEQQQVAAKNRTGVVETVQGLSDVPALSVESWKEGSLGKASVDCASPKVDQSQSVGPLFDLICPQFNKGQNGLTIARSTEVNVRRKEDLTEESDVSIWQRRHDLKSGSMSASEETCKNSSKDSVAESKNSVAESKNSVAESKDSVRESKDSVAESKDCVAESTKDVLQKGNKSEYPALYETDIHSFALKDDDETSEQRFDGYGMDWFSAAYGREPGWNSEKRPIELDVERKGVALDGGSTATPLRSCLKKKKQETAIDDPGLKIKQILPVLSDSSFETLKSIVLSANSGGIVPAKDSTIESRPQVVHSEGQHQPMTAKNPLNVLTNNSFWSPPSFSPHLSSPPFPVCQSPERSLLSPPTFPKAGRLPAPPKPPPCLLPGSQIRPLIPEAFIEPPNAQVWMRPCPPHPGFHSPTMYEPPCHRMNIGSGGNARLAFSPPPPPPPPWVPPEEPSFPTGHSRWLGSHRDAEDQFLQGRRCFPGRPSHEAPTEDWRNYPFDNNSMQRNPATELRPFWQSNVHDTMTGSQNSNNDERYMATERARGMVNTFARDDYTGNEMIERNFERYNNNGSRFPGMETMPQQPLFPHDQDYRQPFCEGGTKSLIDSTYNDRGFHENSYEFFGNVLENGGNFGSLGELLPGFGDLESTDVPERNVDLCDYTSSSQTDGNETTEKFENNDPSNGMNNECETVAVTKEINKVLDSSSNKTDVSIKIEIVNKIEEGDLKIEGDLKTDLNINDDVDIKTEFVAQTKVETKSQSECSAESKHAVKSSPSHIDCETTSGFKQDPETEAMPETSQKTIHSSEVTDKETGSEEHDGVDEGDSLCEALAGLNALIERFAKPDVGPEGRKASGALEELRESSNDVRLIDDVRDIVRKCLDADLLDYSEVCDGLGVSLQLLVEKGTLVDEKALPHVNLSCGESAGGNGESRSQLSLEPCGSPPKSMESGNSSSKSERNSRGLERRGLNTTTHDPKTQEMNVESDATAAHINDSDDCVIDIADDDDIPCSGDVIQTVVIDKVTTKSTLDRVADGKHVVRSEANDDERSLSVRDPPPLPSHVGRRTESRGSGDSIEIGRGRHRSRSRRLLRDSDNSCDSSLDKRQHRHDSRDSSKKWRHHDNTRRCRQDSSESGSYPRHRVGSSGDTAAVTRKRSHDDSSRHLSRKRSRRDCDSDKELEDLWLSSDEEEEMDRRRTSFYSRGGGSSSYQSSESDTQRMVRKKAAAAAGFIVGVDDSRRFVDARLSRDTHPALLSNCLSPRKTHAMRYGRLTSPSERERRRDHSSWKRSTDDDVDERTLRKFWKETRTEERLKEEAVAEKDGRRRRHHRNSSEERNAWNGDREERHRRIERTHDHPRSRHKEDVIRSKRDDAENVGLAAFAGFISRRIPVEVETTEVAWNRDDEEDRFIDGMHEGGGGRGGGGGALDNRNLIIADVDTDRSKVVGGSVGLDHRKMGSKVSRESGTRSRREDDKLLEQHIVGCLVTKTVGNALNVDGLRQKDLVSRERNSSERKQSVCNEPIHVKNSCLSRSCVGGSSDQEEDGDCSAGLLVASVPQRTQIVPGLLRTAPDIHAAENLHHPQHHNDPSHLSEHRRSRASPRKQHSAKVTTDDDDLEDGEIVDAPEEKVWPSATRDLLALLNTPKSWVSPGASITPLPRQQPGPNKM